MLYVHTSKVYNATSYIVSYKTYLLKVFYSACSEVDIIRLFGQINLKKKLKMRSTFVGSAWSFGFSSPPRRHMTSKDFYTRFYPLHFFSYLNSSERASNVEPFNVECQTRELLVPFLLRCCYDAVLDWGLNPGPPALEASTLPLGYRGGGQSI